MAIVVVADSMGLISLASNSTVTQKGVTCSLYRGFCLAEHTASVWGSIVSPLHYLVIPFKYILCMSVYILGRFYNSRFVYDLSKGPLVLAFPPHTSSSALRSYLPLCSSHHLLAYPLFISNTIFYIPFSWMITSCS